MYIYIPLSLLTSLADTQTLFTIAFPTIGAIAVAIVPRLLDRRRERMATDNASKAVAIKDKDVVGRLQDQVFDMSNEMLEQYRKRANEESARADELEALLKEAQGKLVVMTSDIANSLRKIERLQSSLDANTMMLDGQTATINRLTQENAELRASKRYIE